MRLAGDCAVQNGNQTHSQTGRSFTGQAPDVVEYIYNNADELTEDSIYTCTTMCWGGALSCKVRIDFDSIHN